MAEMMIPMLPCVSLPATLAFYRALGFDCTHQQTSPNVYAALRRGGIHLHFFGLKGLKPEDSYSTCAVIVDDLEQLHATFASGLRGALGKLPLTGFPRISRLRPRQTRFTVVDPDGNSVIYIRRETEGTEGQEEDGYEAPEGEQSRLARAIWAAARLRDFKNDDRAAAKVLDAALAKKDPAPAIDRARALAARIELAVVLDDTGRADALRRELESLPLADEERQRVRAELPAVDDGGSTS